MFVTPYLPLMTEEALQRDYRLREVFNGLRYVTCGGIAWRMMLNNLPTWHAVYQQAQHRVKAEVFEPMGQDLRGLLRLAARRAEDPIATIFDSRTWQSSS